MKNLFHINLLGTDFSIKSSETNEYMEQVVSFIKKHINSLAEKTQISDPLKLSILTNIVITSELFKLKENPKEKNMELNAKILEKNVERLVKELEEAIK